MSTHDCLHSLRVSLTKNGTRTDAPEKWNFLYSCVISPAFQSDPPAALAAAADSAPSDKQRENLRAVKSYSAADCRKFGGFVKTYFESKAWNNCDGGANRVKNGGKGRASSKTEKSKAEQLSEKLRSWDGADVVNLAKLAALYSDPARFTLLALTDRANLQSQLDAEAAADREKREKSTAAAIAARKQRKAIALEIKAGLKALDAEALRAVLAKVKELTPAED